LALFAAAFNVWQLIGLTIVCGVFFVELIYIYWQKPKTSTAERGPQPLTESLLNKSQ